MTWPGPTRPGCCGTASGTGTRAALQVSDSTERTSEGRCLKAQVRAVVIRGPGRHGGILSLMGPQCGRASEPAYPGGTVTASLVCTLAGSVDRDVPLSSRAPAGRPGPGLKLVRSGQVPAAALWPGQPH